MSYEQLQNSLSGYFGALGLDRILYRRYREGLWKIITSITVVLAVVALLSLQIEIKESRFIYGFLMIGISVSMILFALESYYRVAYFKDIRNILPEPHILASDPPGSFILAETLSRAAKNDLTGSFFRSAAGRLLATRLGVLSDNLDSFLAGRTAFLHADSFVTSMDAETPLASYALSLFKNDNALREFLFTLGIQEREWLGALDWIVRSEEARKRKKRFWGRDNLGRIQGIGKDWSYGEIYLVEKYSSRLEKLYNLAMRGAVDSRQDEIGEIEVALSRSQEANVILVGDNTEEKMDLVITLAKKILEGTVLPSLEHKKIMVLDANALISANAEKNGFEREFEKVLGQAAKAGDIILVIPDLPAFIASAKSFGSDVASIMDAYISSPLIQVIAMSESTSFHAIVEPNTALMERFEKVILREDDESSLVELLETRAEELEGRYKVFFTYPAVEAVAESASRYFVGQVLSDKALDILIELPSVVLSQGRRIICKKDVTDLVTIKTGIPTGEVGASERDKLVNLEEVLHRRIVGQDEAVGAIAGAMRRARSGVVSAKRPLGSFLFLGPTGVGKTETSKALAEVFFGDENKILRLDMSEYNSADGLERLIGSFEGSKSGVLSSRLRERPYGVLLLDEFEKAHKEVHDLFLQVLDEGVFSDMVGKQVSARNLIIIATSNAGSEIIWEYMKRGDDLAANKDKVVDEIVASRVFRPELLNRFDGVVLFHPLSDVHLNTIAKLMLSRLEKRLAEKGVRLVINDDLINYLVKAGNDPKFGARPLNRAIQDKVESLIAEKMIKGEIKAGSRVELTSQDLNLGS